MTKTATSIEQFIANNFDENSTDYIRLEAKILNSFLKRLVENHDFNIVSVYDGGDVIAIQDNNRFQALDHIFSVDESSVSLTNAHGQNCTLCLLLGNGDATTIYDHRLPNEETEILIDTVFGESVKTHSTELYELNWA